FLCVFATAFFSVPILYVKYNRPELYMLFNISSIFLICTAMLMIFYWTSFQDKSKNVFTNVKRFSSNFILFLSSSMGLSLHNSVAVVEGYMGKKSSFIRTPKFNIVTDKDKWKGNKYLVNNISTITILEGFMTLYFLFGIVSAFLLNDYGLLPFHIMLFWGFGFVFWLSVRQVN
ncbi:MAG: hypothetical protein K8R74_03050, partial [Bacteroidales bacterium]|nr:hypothetical protein [Bacteroidales bacterium]